MDEKFYEWLSQKYAPNTAHSRMSNCETVENYEGDLNNHYNNDRGALLISRLTYTAEDENNNNPPRHNIPINGNIRNGTATYKSAVRLYFRHKEEAAQIVVPPQEEPPAQNQTTVNQREQLPPEHINIIDMAKNVAKHIAGDNDDFHQYIEQVPLDNYFYVEIKKKLTELLYSLTDVQDNNITLYKLIETAATQKVLSDEAKYFAHTIRKSRNILEYQDIDNALKECCNIIILVSFSGIYRYLNNSE